MLNVQMLEEMAFVFTFTQLCRDRFEHVSMQVCTGAGVYTLPGAEGLLGMEGVREPEGGHVQILAEIVLWMIRYSAFGFLKCYIYAGFRLTCRSKVPPLQS